MRPFGILPTINGYDVIALDTGHPVDHRESAQSANGVAYRLNNAALAGPKALANALGARSYPDA